MSPIRWLLLGLLGAPIALAPVVRTTIELEGAEAPAPEGTDGDSAPAPGEDPDDESRGGTPANDDDRERKSIAVPSVFLKPARADTKHGLAVANGSDGEGTDGDDSATDGERTLVRTNGAAAAAADARTAPRTRDRLPNGLRALLRAGRLGLPPPSAA